MYILVCYDKTSQKATKERRRVCFCSQLIQRCCLSWGPACSAIQQVKVSLYGQEKWTSVLGWLRPFPLSIQAETPSSMGWNLLSLVKPLTDIHNSVSPRWFLVSPSGQWRLIITGGTKTFTGWWEHTLFLWRTWDQLPAPVVDALHLLL